MFYCPRLSAHAVRSEQKHREVLTIVQEKRSILKTMENRGEKLRECKKGKELPYFDAKNYGECCMYYNLNISHYRHANVLLICFVM